MRQRLHVVLQALLAVLVVGAAASSHASGPLNLDDVVRLVETGVGPSIIEYQVQRAGLDFEIDVDAIVALRTARADDALIRFLMDTGKMVPDRLDNGANSQEEPPADNGVRIVHRRAPSGHETLVLTNLGSRGRRINDDGPAPVRGIISSSTLGATSPGGATPARIRTGVERAARDDARAIRSSLNIPASIDVTVRHEDVAGSKRVRELEDRLASLEDRRGRADRPPVGATLPQHPINDQRDYPILGPYGYPLLVPFAFTPQPFQVHAAGPFRSFTTAGRGGFDPFVAPQPCQRGQACSVVRRLAHPQQ